MLLQFNVTNALSFKNEAILDLAATSDKSHEDNLITYRKERVLPTVAIYGANAAGKSNLFKALASAIYFVRNSQNMQIDSKISVIPFLMDDEGKNGKTRFDFIYVYDGIKYEYGFVADTDRVYEEYLYAYKSSKPSLIFERTEVTKYRYTTTLRKTLRQYESKNTENKLFLSTATVWNCKETESAFRWFSEMIDPYSSEEMRLRIGDIIKADKDGTFRETAVKLLKSADFNISDYKLSVKEVHANIPLPPGISFDDEVLEHLKSYEIQVFHDVEHNGEIHKTPLPFNAESDGTQLYFLYIPAIIRALKEGRTIVIDEIDNGLHPMIVRQLVELFNDPDTNPNGAQLIFNTHDIDLLDLELLRRDQIYFVEKNNKTGESDLYALSDFSPRKNEKIQKGYMLGRYGAIPNLGGIDW
ncbi:MAG: AAA family ATPase [Anaerovoracaceae bacterium]|jgi:AAA15 family ATPase/GTPase